MPARRSCFLAKEGKARWTTPDPLKDKYPGWSSYNYCGDNPVNRFDPDGRYYWSLTNDQVFEMKKTQAGLSTNYNYTNTGDGENPNNQESSVSITYDFVDFWPAAMPVSFRLALSTVGILTLPLLLPCDDPATLTREKAAAPDIANERTSEDDYILVRPGKFYEGKNKLNWDCIRTFAQERLYCVSLLSTDDPTAIGKPGGYVFKSQIVAAGFLVNPTPTGPNKGHHTLNLSYPVTNEVARRFNALFGRKR